MRHTPSDQGSFNDITNVVYGLDALTQLHR